MNNLVPVNGEIKFGEVMPPCASVRVVGRLHPLNGSRIDRDVEAGLSISEILDEVLPPGLQARRDFAIHIDGHPVEEKNWHRVRIKKGVTLTLSRGCRAAARLSIRF